MTGVTLTVNGRRAELGSLPAPERLLDTLRWRLGLRGTKEGCRSGGCGACTVWVDGRPTLSCLLLTAEAEGAEVVTIEGVGDLPAGARAVRAFHDASAVQCGYCTPGFVMALAGLLQELGSSASTSQLLEELGGNLCRCTGYAAIARAVAQAREDGG